MLDSIARSLDVREILENPSWLFGKKLDDPYDHYIAALIQTRYALEHLKISPKAFFDKAYKPASIEQIRSWLSMES